MDDVLERLEAAEVGTLLLVPSYDEIFIKTSTYWKAYHRNGNTFSSKGLAQYFVVHHGGVVVLM